jgi:hypothetical protein
MQGKERGHYKHYKQRKNDFKFFVVVPRVTTSVGNSLPEQQSNTIEHNKLRRLRSILIYSLWTMDRKSSSKMVALCR